MVKAIFVIAYFVLLGLNVWIYLIKYRKAMKDKVKLILQIIGVYTAAFGILAQADLVVNDIAVLMTSSNLFEFIQGNFFFGAVLFEALGTAFDGLFLSSYALIKLPVLIIMALAFFIYFIFHLFFIVPFSYIAYLVASIPVDAIAASKQSTTITFGKEVAEINNIVVEHSLAVKNFIIAFPALIISRFVDVVSEYRQKRTKGDDQTNDLD